MHVTELLIRRLYGLSENLSQFDIIINTVPHLILDSKKLEYINRDSLLIDLASKPGGIDMDFAKKIGIKVVWALALPGKVAPLTSAKFIKETIYNIIKSYYLYFLLVFLP